MQITPMTDGERVVIDITAAGADQTIVAAQPGRKIYLWQYFFVNGHATQDVACIWKEGSTAVSGAYVVKADGGAHSAPYTGMPWAVAPAGSALILNTSAAGSLKGTAYVSYSS